ncbi:MAG: FAD-binding protein [Cyclobacteriaceae bacterium]|nr:FAD-binding protein [Cyclobacteriaceae bacterium]
MQISENQWKSLAAAIDGELFYDKTMRTLYATDASAYRALPEAVVFPKSVQDLRQLIRFAREQKTSLIPRTAGTSLAGQVVGDGIVVDVSKYFTRIIEVNEEEKWVRLEPGVIRDDLNKHLKAFNLYFGPETSTANRAMVGGMVGNNSCGSNSVVFGSTREHLISAKILLSDGSETELKALNAEEFAFKCSDDNPNTLERSIYQEIANILKDPLNQEEINKGYPKKSIPRRNTGYALDLLLDTEPFETGKQAFNFCKLLAGSEGTLAFITELKLNLEIPPPSSTLVVCCHFNDIIESLESNLIALKYKPWASELMDKYILDCTKDNIEQRKNRFFVEGDPAALLVVDLSHYDPEEAEKNAALFIQELKSLGMGYHYPILRNEEAGKVWSLRKAGLGLLANMPGDDKAVPVIEDTAVDVADLPAYIKEFNEILDKYGLYSVHYAHAGSGELHLRPILNLKTEEGNRMFRTILEEIAALVKKYEGSLSGEHGDGRLRGEFIRFMVGDHNFSLIEKVKRVWDPENIFNPGKIVDTPSMNSSLRFMPGHPDPQFDTTMDFSHHGSILRAAEQCNGSGDCRKTHISGGTMCPSYMATRNEKDTTRARANIVREILTFSEKENKFDSEEIKEVMDYCLSCKGCKSECPSNVDIAKIKAEFLQQYYDVNGVPLRARLISNFTSLNRLASLVPWAYNAVFSIPLISGWLKSAMGFAKQRSMPLLHSNTLKNWYEKNKKNQFGLPEQKTKQGKVLLFCDEFTNYNDVPTGKAAIRLLTALGYDVIIPKHLESGRTYISKGLLKQAREIGRKNIEALSPLVGEGVYLVGIEPSALLTLRDEYHDFAGKDLAAEAQKLSEHSLLIDEFLAIEFEAGRIDSTRFTTREKLIKLHGHCHQKALASVVPTKKMLSIPCNYSVQLIPSGCCGMAGSFGYEKEHYELSMQIGELVLFPTVRQQADDVLIAAPGTSCRHQVKDGTGKTAMHPVEILWEALENK